MWSFLLEVGRDIAGLLCSRPSSSWLHVGDGPGHILELCPLLPPLLLSSTVTSSPQGWIHAKAFPDLIELCPASAPGDVPLPLYVPVDAAEVSGAQAGAGWGHAGEDMGRVAGGGLGQRRASGGRWASWVGLSRWRVLFTLSWGPGCEE